MVYELSPSPTSAAFVAERQVDAEAARETAAKNGAAPLVEKAIGDGRPVRVVAIGAGFSGIGACIYLPQHIKNLDLQVYERATDIGGVCELDQPCRSDNIGHHNKYMGAACDIPAHTYQFTFADNSQWSQFYAGGKEIHQYLTNVVDHYKLRPLIKLQHTVLEARWLETEGKWALKVQDATGRVFEDRCDFVYYATGLLSNPVWPKIPGELHCWKFAEARPRHVQGSHSPHGRVGRREGGSRGYGLERQARRCHWHRLQCHPGHAGDAAKVQAAHQLCTIEE